MIANLKISRGSNARSSDERNFIRSVCHWRMEPCMDPNDGLSDAAAAARLESDGYNDLASGKRRSLFHVASDVVREPMFLLLIACGSIYVVLGDKGEALML